MKYRDLITSYAEDLQLFRTRVSKFWFALLIVGLAALPWIGSALGGSYLLYLINMAVIAVIVALGMNLLLGCAGLISLGHAAFVAVGAYTAAVLANQLDFPFWMTVTLSGAVTGLVGIVVGLPALRIKGLYLGLATLAFQFIADHVIVHAESVTGGPNGLSVPPPALGAFAFDTYLRFFYIAAPLALLLGLAMANLQRSRIGRAFVAIRESEVAAEALAIDLTRYKTIAYAISALYAGVAGGLFAAMLGIVVPESYDLFQVIAQFAMVVVGGIGSVWGAVIGAVGLIWVQEALRAFKEFQEIAFGGMILLTVLFLRGGAMSLIKRHIKGWDEPLRRIPRKR